MKTFTRIRLTIGTKLVSIIALLLMGSVASLVWMSTRMFTEDNTALIQQMNADTAASLASQIREAFENATEKTRVLGTVLIQDISPPETKDRIVSEFFAKDKDFVLVLVHRHGADGSAVVQNRAASPEMAALGDADGEKALAALLADKRFSMEQATRGEVQLALLKLADGSPAAALTLPFIQVNNERFSHTVTAFIRASRFVKAFGESDIITSYMVDRYGRLVAHPDTARVAAGESVGHLAVVKQMLEGKFNNGQTRYNDGIEEKLGAFRAVGFAGLGVVAEVPEAKAFESAIALRRRAILFAFTVLCISFFVGYLFSGTITWPIKQLVLATGRISQGDFKINLKPRGHDEVADLSKAVNEMAKGLEERDRVKETFNKFHNKEIADKLLSGEVKLGGERKEATIFFSDVRGFTGMSESMSPEQVVEMLNEYMTRMVAVIRAHNGIVDKYVGDAIMALWGVPLGGEADSIHCVRACIEMRQELARLNELRISRGQPVLKIGMGVNTGPVIAGNIGSTEKMEYTVIGDSVNLASRIESMTKEYGTDLLISKYVYEKVKDKFLVEACAAAKVKGKSEAIQIYRVLGYIAEDGSAVKVETPYSSYTAEKSDKVVHDKSHPAAEADAKEEHSGHNPESGVRGPDCDQKSGMDPAPAPDSAPIDAPTPDLAAQFAALPDPETLLARDFAPTKSTPVSASAPAQARSKSPAQAASPTAAATATASQWYINYGGEIFGPFSPDEVQSGITSRELTATMAASPSLDNPRWMPLSSWHCFKGHFRPEETRVA